jgi:hypothetical protein
VDNRMAWDKPKPRRKSPPVQTPTRAVDVPGVTIAIIGLP